MSVLLFCILSFSMAFCHPHKHQESNTVYTIRNEKKSVEAPLYISFFCVWHCTSKRCCSCSITKSPLLLSFSDCRYKAEIVVATLCKNKNLKPPLHITVQRYLNVVAIYSPLKVYTVVFADHLVWLVVQIQSLWEVACHTCDFQNYTCNKASKF